MPERAPTADVSPIPQFVSPATLNLLNTIGNHEGQLALAAIIATNLGTVFRGRGLHRQLEMRQGIPDGWVPDAGNVVNALKNALVPSGAVRVVRVASETGKSVPGYQADPELGPFAAAFSGASMGWGLLQRHADIPLRFLWGKSMAQPRKATPPQHESTPVAGPQETRLRIYEQLLGDSKVRDVADIHRGMGADRFTYNTVLAHVTRMARAGILSKRTKGPGYNPTYTIGERTPPKGRQTLERQTLVSVVDALRDKNRKQITLNDLLALIEQRGEDIDLEEIRVDLRTHPDAPTIGLTRKPDAGFSNQQRLSAVSLTTRYRRPIADLYRRIIDLQDPDSWDYYQRLARSILNDAFRTGLLLNKAGEHSPQTSHGDQNHEPLGLALPKILQQHGALSVQQITDQLDMRGHHVHQNSIAPPLATLVAEGRVQTGLSNPQHGAKRSYITYEWVMPDVALGENDSPFATDTQPTVGLRGLSRANVQHEPTPSQYARHVMDQAIATTSALAQEESMPLPFGWSATETHQAMATMVKDIFERWEQARSQAGLPPLITEASPHNHDLVAVTAKNVFELIKSHTIHLAKTTHVEALTALLTYWGPTFTGHWLDGTAVAIWGKLRGLDPVEIAQWEGVLSPTARRNIAIKHPAGVIAHLDALHSLASHTLTYDRLAHQLGWSIPEARYIIDPAHIKQIALVHGAGTAYLSKIQAAHARLTDEAIAAYLGMSVDYVQVYFHPMLRKHLAFRYPDNPLQACRQWRQGVLPPIGYVSKVLTARVDEVVGREYPD